MKLQDIKKVGVCGGGTMGFGVGINFALCGYPTAVYDLSDQILEQCSARIQKGLKIFVDEGLITQELAAETFERFTFTTDISEVVDNDFITEAIIERLPDKQELFRKLDRMCQPHTILASNTSSLLLTEIAQGIRRQDKVVLTHYFDPAYIVPCVEVAKGAGTTDETFDITYELMKKIKKVPVKVLKEVSGYLINSIQFAAQGTALRLWAEGVASAEDIELAAKTSYGFRGPTEGPLGRHDMGGGFRWPKDALRAMTERSLAEQPGMKEELKNKIRRRVEEGKPWFIDPSRYDEVVEANHREYARRLRELYWNKSGL